MEFEDTWIMIGGFLKQESLFAVQMVYEKIRIL